VKAVTYSSGQITAKINKINKKLQCYPVEGENAAAPSNWDAKEPTTQQPYVRVQQCGEANSECVVTLTYLKPGTKHTIWCRPENVDASKKSVALTTAAAPAVGTDTVKYNVVMTLSNDLTIETFNANTDLKTKIASAVKELLKLPTDATVSVSAYATATSRKFITQATNLKVQITITKVQAGSAAAIHAVLTDAVKTGAFNVAMTASGATVVTVATTSAVENPQAPPVTPPSGGKDDDGAVSAMFSVVSVFFSLFFFAAAWL